MLVDVIDEVEEVEELVETDDSDELDELVGGPVVAPVELLLPVAVRRGRTRTEPTRMTITIAAATMAAVRDFIRVEIGCDRVCFKFGWSQ